MSVSPLTLGETVYFELAGRVAVVHEINLERVVFKIGAEFVEGGAELFSQASSRIRLPNLHEIYARRWSDGEAGVRDELLSLSEFDRVRACARFATTGPARKSGQGRWSSVEVTEIARIWKETTGRRASPWLKATVEKLKAAPLDDLRLSRGDVIAIESPEVPALLERILEPPRDENKKWEPKQLMYSATYRLPRGRSLCRVADEDAPYDAVEERLLHEALVVIQSSRVAAEQGTLGSAYGPRQAIYGRCRRLFFGTFYSALKKRLTQKLKNTGDYPADEILSDLRDWIFVSSTSHAEVVELTECPDVAAWLDDEPLTSEQIQRCCKQAVKVVDDASSPPRNVKRFVWETDLSCTEAEASFFLADQCCDNLIEGLISDNPSPPAVARLAAFLDGATPAKPTSALVHDALSAQVDRLISLGKLLPADEVKEQRIGERAVSTEGHTHGRGSKIDLDRQKHTPTFGKQAYPPRTAPKADKEFRHFVQRPQSKGTPQERRARALAVTRALQTRFARQCLRRGYEETPTGTRKKQAQRGTQVVMAIFATRLPLSKAAGSLGVKGSTARTWFARKKSHSTVHADSDNEAGVAQAKKKRGKTKSKKDGPPEFVTDCFPPEISRDYKSRFCDAYFFLRDQLLPAAEELSQVLRDDPSDERLDALLYLFFEANLDEDGKWTDTTLEKTARGIGLDVDGLTRFLIDTIVKVMHLRRAKARRKGDATVDSLSALTHAEFDALALEIALYGAPDPAALVAALEGKDPAAVAARASLTPSELTDLALGRSWLATEDVAESLAEALGEDGAKAIRGLVRRPLWEVE